MLSEMSGSFKCRKNEKERFIFMEGTELVAFNIIASVGTARSCYINAIDLALEGQYDEANALIKEGQEAFNGGHEAHQELLVNLK